MPPNLSILWTSHEWVNDYTSCLNLPLQYCKSGNIRGTLIFANFAQNSASANSKTRENICDILHAHFGHVGVIDHVC